MHNDFYVYLHRRKSDNQVFYVGKGRQYRATTRSNRSRWWHAVADKHGYVVEYIKQGLGEGEAFQLEIATIKAYRNTTELCNLSDGGEGPAGAVRKPEITDGTMIDLDIKIPTVLRRMKDKSKGNLKKSINVVMANVLTGNKIYYSRGSKTQTKNNRKKLSPYFITKAVHLLIDLGYVQECYRCSSVDSVKVHSSIVSTGKFEEEFDMADYYRKHTETTGKVTLQVSRMVDGEPRKEEILC